MQGIKFVLVERRYGMKSGLEKVYGALDKKNLYKNKTSAQYQNENEFIIPDVNNTRPEIMVYVNGILGE